MFNQSTLTYLDSNIKVHVQIAKAADAQNFKGGNHGNNKK